MRLPRRQRSSRLSARSTSRRRLRAIEPLEVRRVLDSTVVFNELMYHPLGDPVGLEWLELHNQQAVNMDISGWSIDGIGFTFPAATIIAGGNYIVVAASPSAFQTATGIAGAYGPFTGGLSNSGEQLELRDNNERVMDTIEFGDDGDWPVAADGAGSSLAKRAPNTGSPLASSWSASAQIGGTPDAQNFPPSTPQVVESTVVNIDDTWKFNQSGDLGTSWRETGYDDTGWSSGQGLFYVTAAAMPAPKNTPLTIGQRTYYFRTTFNFDGDVSLAGLRIHPIVDDGAVYYLNGEEVYRQNMPPAPTTITYNLFANPAVGNAVYTGPFTIPVDDLLVGENLIAVEVHQSSAGSPDVVFGTELLLTETILPPENDVSSLALNEIAGAADVQFSVELVNHGTIPIDLTGIVVTRLGAATTDYILAAQSLGAGQLLALNQATLGFDPFDGDKIVLYTPGKADVLDAVVVKTAVRGRSPAGTGAWLYEDAATFGAANSFSLRDDVVINELMYHHRPTLARPGVFTETTHLAIGGNWKYDDTGVDLGTAWQAAAYDDTAWPTGGALLYNETASLPAPKVTQITAGRNTYYFRTSFPFSGDPAGVQLQLDHILDDGAVFYLNGQEVYRFNMPGGAVSYATSASTIIDNATQSGPIVIPATGLIDGTNVLAVEVHQASAPAGGSGPTITPSAGYTIAWDGSDGAFNSPSNPALAPDNPGLATHGVAAFGSSQFNGGGIHLIAHANDGLYGNSKSWIANFAAVPSGDPNPYIGLNFNQALSISSIAWGRDNGNTVTDACGGTCGDRWGGTYTVQVTNVASPGTGTAETGDPETGWKTIGTLLYSSASPGFTPYLRHRYTVAQGGNPISATGLRIKVSDDDIAIDEIEINAATDSGNTDVVFGTKLSSLVATTPPQPFAESSEEWIELFNRSASPIDLTGWRLDEGIDFAFPVATVIPPGGYLVVADDHAALAAKFPSATIVGDFGSSLANSSDRVVLKDQRGNPVDDVTYYDSGRWPLYPDGGGSSLELRDPDADNSQPEAWAASDESARSTWQTYTYRGTAAFEYPREQWNEFVLGLFDEGEVLLDDIQVVEFPSGAVTHKLQNESFQADTIGAAPAAWRINGNHRTSRVVVDPANGANKVLHLISTGHTSDETNHAETTFIGNQAVVNGREYEISFKAKWLAGNNQLNTRLYFNRLARTTVLDVPDLSGTPGAVNSRSVANAGPTYSGLSHLPVVPALNEPVTVMVTAADPDGIGGLTLKYSANGGALQTAAMSHQGGGVYTAQINGQAASVVVQFFVEGQDSLGAMSTFPAAGVASRALYKVQDNADQSGAKHNLRIVMTTADANFMYDPANLMSGEHLRGTVIYDESEVFYDVGVRLKGSMPARQSSAFVGFHIRFSPEHKFRGVHDTLSIDRSGRGALVSNGQEEILIKQMMLAAGGIPEMYDDLVYIVAPRASETGSALLIMAEYNNDFLDSQYDNGSDGTLFNFDLIYQQTATTTGGVEGPKTPVGYTHPTYNVDLENLGPNPETYRWHFRIENNRDRDDYSQLMEFLAAMSLPAGGYGSPLDLATREVMDLDQWMRKFAAESLAGVGTDYYGRGLNHNLKLYVRPEDGKVLAFPWDMDNSAFNPGLATADLFPSANVRKVIEIPANKRLFYGHLQHLMSSTFNSTYLAQWTSHYISLLPGQTGLAGALGFMNQRVTHVTNNLPSAVPFQVTSGDAATSIPLLASNVPATALVPSVANGGDQLGLAWTQIGFDDAAWADGSTGVGYERATGYGSLIGLDVDALMDTDNNDLNENNSVFIRVPFNVDDPSIFDTLKLRMKYDDGFVAYINGQKVFERNQPASPTWNSAATASHDDAAAVVFEDRDISAFLNALVPGENVLAIHGLNFGNNSTDMIILPELSATDVEQGSGISVTTPTAVIEGDGWINVRTIKIAGRDAPLTLEWPDLDSWQAVVPLAFGTHPLTFNAYDFDGNLIGSDTLTVTTTAGQPVQDALRVTEVMYHPANPSAAELAIDPTFGDDDFEFLEIRNIGPGTIDLSGVKVLGGVSFDFTGSAVTSLAPGGFVLVVESLSGMPARYGSGMPIAGEYSGQLSNGGESLTLQDGLGQTIQTFTYDDTGAGWHPPTDGDGPSLAIINENAATSTWNSGASWRPSVFPLGSPGTDDVLPIATIVGRHIYYNHSAWDGNSALANAADDGAIATDKAPLLPGGTASRANYTSFSKGITGIFVDVQDPSDSITAADFSFKTGNVNNTAAWTPLAVPPTVTVRPGAGAGGSDRVALTWPEGTIKKTWLQVTMLETAATGLSANDVFYFGNAVGEAGDTTANALVNATDEIQARANPRNIVNPAPITFLYDYNRDKLVNATDQIIARSNTTNIVSALRLIVPVGAAGAASPQGAALADAAFFDPVEEAVDVFARRRKR